MPEGQDYRTLADEILERLRTADVPDAAMLRRATRLRRLLKQLDAELAEFERYFAGEIDEPLQAALLCLAAAGILTS